MYFSPSVKASEKRRLLHSIAIPQAQRSQVSHRSKRGSGVAETRAPKQPAIEEALTRGGSHGAAKAGHCEPLGGCSPKSHREGLTKTLVKMCVFEIASCSVRSCLVRTSFTYLSRHRFLTFSMQNAFSKSPGILRSRHGLAAHTAGGAMHGWRCLSPLLESWGRGVLTTAS